MMRTDAARKEMFDVIDSLTAIDDQDEICAEAPKLFQMIFYYFTSTPEGLGELSDVEKEILEKSMRGFIEIFTKFDESSILSSENCSLFFVKSLLSGIVYTRTEIIPTVLELQNERVKDVMSRYPGMIFTLFYRLENYTLILLKLALERMPENDDQSYSCNHYWWTRAVTEDDCKSETVTEEYELND